MRNIAQRWEDKFEFLQRERTSRHYRKQLKSFLHDLHANAKTFETQSDGTKLLIFADGSVYGDESELERILNRFAHVNGNPIACANPANTNKEMR
jgi:hypothetical protein